MKIAILSKKPKLYSTKRLVELAKDRGHEVKVLNHLRCYMNITLNKPTLSYKGQQLPLFDAVIPRISSSASLYGTAVLRQLEMMGVYSANESTAITQSIDKLRSLQLLSSKGIGMPVSGFANSLDDTRDLIKILGGPPLVIKLIEGTQGNGLVLAKTQKAAESEIKALLNLDGNILVQEFIEEAGGADIKCFVIDGKVVAAMKRQAPEGEFRSNLHLGGKATTVELTPQEIKSVIDAAKIAGLNVAGVDFLRSNRGPLIKDINASPGLEAIEQCTGKDVAGMIIRFIEDKIKPIKTQTG